MLYVAVTIAYINDIYILNDASHYELFDTMITIAVIYPALYDWT